MDTLKMLYEDFQATDKVHINRINSIMMGNLDFQQYVSVMAENVEKLTKAGDLAGLKKQLKLMENLDVTTFFQNLNEEGNSKKEDEDIDKIQQGKKNVEPPQDKSVQRNSLKENGKPSKTSKRPLRQALKDTTQLANNSSNNVIDNLNVVVKREKMSNMGIVHSAAELLAVKKEQMEMPPPALRAVKKTRRKKEPQIKIERVSKKITTITEDHCPSDCIFQDPKISIVAIEDDGELSSETNANQVPCRVTRSKRVQKQFSKKSTDEEPSRVTRSKITTVEKQSLLNTASSFSSDTDVPEVPLRVTRSKVVKQKVESIAKKRKIDNVFEDVSNKDNDNTEVFEDAISDSPTDDLKSSSNVMLTESEAKDQNEQTIANDLPTYPKLTMEFLKAKLAPTTDKTFVVKNSSLTVPVEHNNPNQTVIISKNNQNVVNGTVIVSKSNDGVVATTAISSNDENIKDMMTDDESDDTLPPPKKATKLIFSPFDNSPVKKRVQAFEKLLAQEPTRLACMKTRHQNDATDNAYAKEDTTKIPQSLEMNKLIKTPQYNTKYILSSATSASKATVTTMKSIIPPRTNSALKASQQEYRERQKMQEELKRKKELKAVLDEKKQIRERELKKRELQRQREEKAKQLTEKQLALEKQQKLQVQREAEKRRLLAKKNKDKKIVEAERQMGKEKQQIESMQVKQKVMPVYKIKKAPLLPTYDCYDSGDEETPKHKLNKPQWVRSEPKHSAIKLNEKVDYKLRNTLFNIKPSTPDLVQLFAAISPRKLQRKSSAVWANCPRFTLMPDLEEEEV